jgi:hypothetical protein
MATLILLVLLTSVVGLVAPRPASACSCAELDPTTALDEYPAAFVGTLVDVDGQLGAVFNSADDTVYRFEVESWVKGDLGRVVDVHSAADGASCGIEVGVGNRAGIMVRVEGGEYHSSLCETIDADVLLASVEPFETGAPGRPLLFVSASFGGFDYLVVNENGGIMSALANENSDLHDRPWHFSSCSDGPLFLELSSWQLTVRDRTDLSVVRQVSLEGFADEVGVIDARCMDADGSTIWVVGDRWVGDRSVVSIYNATDELRPISEIPAGQTALSDTYAIVQEYQRDDRVLVFDYESGESTTLHSIVRTDDTYIGVASVAPSPDGSTIALLEVTFAEPDTTSSLILYHPSGQEINRIEIDAEGWSVDWIDEERVVVSTSNPDYTHHVAHIFSAPELAGEIELEGWQATDPVLDGDILYGRDGGQLMKADLRSGEVALIATYPVQYLGPIALLPADFSGVIKEVSSSESESTSPSGTVPLVTADAVTAAANESASTIAQVVFSILAGIGLVAIGLARSGRLANRQTK